MATVDTNNRIDFKAIAERADLAALITQSQGPQDRTRRWICPFHDDHHPSLGLSKDRKSYKCYACGKKGDALNWLVETGSAATPLEAARLLDPSIPSSRERQGGAKPRTIPQTVKRTPDPENASTGVLERPETCRDPHWQAALDRAICEAEKILWSPDGAEALQWLHSRGLKDWTVAKFRLGFLPGDWRSEPLAAIARDEKSRPIWLPRGIVIPWLARGAWYGDLQDQTHIPFPRWVGANVRRLMPDPFEPWQQGPKCVAATGSARGFGYPFADALTNGVPTLIVEGEIDALLAFQHLGHLVNVATVGGASQRPERGILEELRERSPVWILALDCDQAGEAGVAIWREIGGSRCRRALYPPEGADIGELVQAGVDLQHWLRSEFRRFGLKI